MRVLVLDDSTVLRAILKRILEQLGFEVFEAQHGAEGLDHLRRHGAMDVALVDWNMPVMGGLEFVRQVRQDNVHASMPILMVTSETDLTHVVQALEAGANEYVMKPVSRESISEKLAILGVPLRG